ncbi:uncharacterized protein LOC125680929 isoform X2 [Ostrea edulis]|uniref:uncharacterized protein LOC125680929 isoform X2 n=1 Tax=Ostrea edulis TaxID=37623 RepID=UPI00209595A0|nr:uncharacterized protein LOC125680929 isoform X2 [Ostrea edulis]
MIAVFTLISIVGAFSINQHGGGVHAVPLIMEAKISHIFHDMDKDHDYFISITEILNFFAVYDLDNPNGINPTSIDLSEFKQSWSYRDTDSQKALNFNQMDANKDGSLTDVDLAGFFATADTDFAHRHFTGNVNCISLQILSLIKEGLDSL